MSDLYKAGNFYFSDGASEENDYTFTTYTTSTDTSPALPFVIILLLVLLAITVVGVITFFICRCFCDCCGLRNRGRVIALSTETGSLSVGQSGYAYPSTGSYLSGSAPGQYPIEGASNLAGAVSYPTVGAPHSTSGTTYPTWISYPSAPPSASNASGVHQYPNGGFVKPVSNRSGGGDHCVDSQLPLISLQ